MPVEIDSTVDHALQWAVDAVGSTAYPFKCLSFVEDAYERSNGLELSGYAYAKEAADYYGAQDDGGVPPRGTLAFYDCWGTIGEEYRNWGHVGLSLGDGRVVHGWDEVRMDDYLGVQNLTPAAGWTPPRYIGWAPVPAVLKGMRKATWLPKGPAR